MALDILPYFYYDYVLNELLWSGYLLRLDLIDDDDDDDGNDDNDV